MNSFQKIIAIFLVLLSTVTLSLGQASKIRIACVGNSITNGGGGTTAYPVQLGKILGSHYDVRNYGISGATLLRKGDLPYWNQQAFKNAKDFDPHIVIIKLGTNDSKPQNWIYKSDFLKDYVDLVNEFRKNGRKPQIYVARPCPAFKINFGIRPTIIEQEVLPLVDSIRKSTNTYLIDFNTPFIGKSGYFPDGIHPNAAGYLIMAQIADSTLKAAPSGIIRYLYADKTTLEKNETAKIYWETTEGTAATLNGVQVKSVDSLVVTLTKDSSYKLITKGAKSDTATISLQYVPPGKIKLLNTTPKVLEKNMNESSQLEWATSAGSVVTINSQSAAANGTMVVSPKTTTDYELKATGEITEIKKITIEVLDAEKINRSLNGSSKASSSSGSFVIDNVIDGNLNTLWKSGLEKAPWFYIDLKRTFEVYKIIIKWGNNFSSNYILQSINEAGAVSEIYTEQAGDGDTDIVDNLKIVGRYFGIYCVSKSIPDSGLVMKEFEVYAKQNITKVQSAESTPLKYSLYQNYPNPFNPETTITFQLQEAGKINLKIFDMLGREVAILADEFKAAGTYNYNLSIRNFQLSSGVYFYKLTAGNFAETKKLIVLK